MGQSEGMDPATVAAHLEHRVTETVASTAPLERLTEAERVGADRP